MFIQVTRKDVDTITIKSDIRHTAGLDHTIFLCIDGQNYIEQSTVDSTVLNAGVDVACVTRNIKVKIQTNQSSQSVDTCIKTIAV